MATAPVDIPVKVRGLSDLQKLERRMEALEKEVARLTKQLPKAANGMKKTGRAAATATGNIQRLGVAFRTTLAPIVAVYGAINFLSKSLEVASQRQVNVAKLTNGLKNLGGTAADLENLVDAADKFGRSTLFDQEDAERAFAFLTSFQRIGVDSYTRVTDAAADLATVTGQDLNSAMTQLAKALEDPARRVTDLARSGTVFTEQQKAQIKALQDSGRLFEAQNLILKEIEKQYGGAAEAAGNAGLAGAMDTLGEATRDFQQALMEGNGVINIAEEAILLLADAIDAATKELKKIQDIVAAIDIVIRDVTGGTYGFRDAIDALTQKVIEMIPGLSQVLWLYNEIAKAAGQKVADSKGGRNFGENYASQEKALFEAAGGYSPYGKNRPTPTPTPTPTKSDASAAKAQKAAAQLAERQLKAAQDLVFASENRLRLLKEMTPVEKLQEEAAVEKLRIERSYAKRLEASASATETVLLQVAQVNELKAVEVELEQQLADLREGATSPLKDEIALLEAKLAGKEDEYRLTKAIKDLEAKGVNPQEAAVLVQRRKELQNQLETWEEIEAQVNDVTTMIADNLGQAFKDVVTGAKSAEEAMADAFKNIGESFIDMALDIIKQQLVMIANQMILRALGAPSASAPAWPAPPPTPTFAGGGYTGDGPRTGGVDGRGGFPAILHPQETVVDHYGAMNRYSPGGGADGGAGGAVNANVTYSGPTLNFNGDDYIPRSEAKNLVAAGAKAGQAQTMRTLQNSRSQRSKLGMS